MSVSASVVFDGARLARFGIMQEAPPHEFLQVIHQMVAPHSSQFDGERVHRLGRLAKFLIDEPNAGDVMSVFVDVVCGDIISILRLLDEVSTTTAGRVRATVISFCKPFTSVAQRMPPFKQLGVHVVYLPADPVERRISSLRFLETAPACAFTGDVFLVNTIGTDGTTLEEVRNQWIIETAREFNPLDRGVAAGRLMGLAIRYNVPLQCEPSLADSLLFSGTAYVNDMQRVIRWAELRDGINDVLGPGGLFVFTAAELSLRLCIA